MPLPFVSLNFLTIASSATCWAPLSACHSVMLTGPESAMSASVDCRGGPGAASVHAAVRSTRVARIAALIQLLFLDEVFWRYMTKQQIVTSRRGSTSLQKSGGFPRRSANVSRLDRALLVVFEGRVRSGRCRREGVFGLCLLGRDLRLHLGDRVADLLITADAWTGDAPRDEIEGLFALGPPGPVVLQRLVVGGRSAKRHVTGRRRPSRGLFAVAEPLQEFPGRKLLFGSRLG